MSATADARPAALPWKPNWPEAAQHFVEWWEHCGMVLTLGDLRPAPRVELPPAPEQVTAEQMWISPEHRVPHWLHIHAQRSQLGDDLPQICNTVGAGDLAAMLGCPWHFTPNTVWFEPIAGEPKDWPSLAFTRRPACLPVRARPSLRV